MSLKKLKTLKDIEENYQDQFGWGSERELSDDLRQSAREWVASYEKDKEIVEKPFYMKHIKNKDALLLRNQIICNWIKHFFNLEDE